MSIPTRSARILAAALLAAGGLAAGTAEVRPGAGETALASPGAPGLPAEARQFDFWLGEWVNLDILWATVQDSLPPLVRSLEKALAVIREP